MTHMATELWVSIASGSGLLPEDTKPLPEAIWLITNGLLWHSPYTDFTGIAQDTSWQNGFEKFTSLVELVPYLQWG